jgi:palmitoyltransferase
MSGLIEADFANWIDAKMSKNGLTPLHIASYKGKNEIIRKLLNSGARHTIKSKYGMNVVHFAAQNNQPWPITFFREQYNVDLDDKDDDGNTPLHWACHFGSITAAEFILKWTKALNECNNAGHSPLRLAVESAISNDNTRLVRILLFAGADRNLKDKEGKIPIEVVTSAEEEGKYEQETINELKKMLVEPKDCACLMLRIPMKKLELNPFLVVCFFIFKILANFFSILSITTFSFSMAAITLLILLFLIFSDFTDRLLLLFPSIFTPLLSKKDSIGFSNTIDSFSIFLLSGIDLPFSQLLTLTRLIPTILDNSD